MDTHRSSISTRNRPRQIHTRISPVFFPFLRRRRWCAFSPFPRLQELTVLGYPDRHPDTENDEDTEIDHLKAKVDAGAEFIVTQLFYDVDQFLLWVKKVRAKGITVPIIPGILPIQTYSSFNRLIKLCGTSVPDHVMQDLESIKHDDQLVKDYGVILAVNMIRRLTTEGGITGVHFCTLNLEKSVQRVLESLQWTGIASPSQHKNKLIEDEANDDGMTVTPTTATKEAKVGLASLPTMDGEAGSGELNNAASWDDFPNGRFGDFKSPAYGNQDPWGNVASIVSIQHCILLPALTVEI